jgi:hypothetical protein
MQTKQTAVRQDLTPNDAHGHYLALFYKYIRPGAHINLCLTGYLLSKPQLLDFLNGPPGLFHFLPSCDCHLAPSRRSTLQHDFICFDSVIRLVISMSSGTPNRRRVGGVKSRYGCKTCK